MKKDDTNTYIRKIKPKQIAKIYDTIILGDVHLGLDVCRIMALIEFIKITKFKRLIFQGDTWNHPSLTSLPSEHLAFLQQVLALEESGVEVIWIQGNHDTPLLPLLDRFYRKGCVVEEKYVFETGEKKRYLVLHGHVFDEILTKFPLTSEFFTWAYEVIQKYDGEAQSLAAFLKSKAKTITKLNEVLKWEGYVYAKANQCDAVVCGHTHKLHHEKFRDDGKVVHYFNAGCWTESKCGAIGICSEGRGHVLRITTWRKPRKT